MYASPEDCIMVGIGGRPEAGGCNSCSPLSSAPFVHQGTKVGLWRLLQRDRRLDTRRIAFDSRSGLSCTPDSCTPKDLLGRALLSGVETLILRKVQRVGTE